MEKVQSNIQETEEMKALRDKSRQRVLADEEIQRLLSDYHLSDDAIEHYLTRLNVSLDAKERCATCVQTANCPFTPKGFRPTALVEEERLIVDNIACEKYRKKMMDEKYIANYLYSDIRKDNYELSLEKELMESYDQDSLARIKMVSQFKEWHDDPEKGGLYLYGPSGSGKTYYATCVANDFAHAGKRVVFFNVNHIITNLRTGSSIQDELKDVLGLVREAEVLVLDGLGTESVIPDWRDFVLLSTLDVCLENDTILIATSCLPYEDLSDYYRSTIYRDIDENKAQMIQSRIVSLTRPIEIVRR